MKSLLFGILPLVVFHVSGILATKPAPIVFAIQVPLKFIVRISPSLSEPAKRVPHQVGRKIEALDPKPGLFFKFVRVFLKLVVAVVSVCPIQCDEPSLGGVGSPVR